MNQSQTATHDKQPQQLQPQDKEHVLLWFDLETTGLNEQEDVILEVGWGISGLHLGWIVEPMSYVIDQPFQFIPEIRQGDRQGRQAVLIAGREVDPYVANMHKVSGLWDAIETGPTLSIGKAEQAITSVLDSYRPAKITMAGSGVSQFDMRWIRHHMPDLHAMLTYYCIDMGTYERTDSVLRGAGIRASRGAADHRAVEDIEFAHRLAMAHRAFLLAGTPYDRNDP